MESQWNLNGFEIFSDPLKFPCTRTARSVDFHATINTNVESLTSDLEMRIRLHILCELVQTPNPHDL